MIDLANTLRHAPLLYTLSTAPGGVKIIIALVILALCLAPALGQTSLEISSDYRQFRDCYAWFGITFGRWQPLPPIVGVTLKYFSTISSRRSKYNWNATTSRNEELVVLLSVRNSTTGMVIGRFDPDNVNLAIDFAHDTAEHLGVEVHYHLPTNQFRPL